MQKTLDHITLVRVSYCDGW